MKYLSIARRCSFHGRENNLVNVLINLILKIAKKKDIYVDALLLFWRNQSYSWNGVFYTNYLLLLKARKLEIKK